MKRKDYQRPTMQVVQLQHKCQMLAGSPYETTGSTSINAMADDEDL